MTKGPVIRDLSRVDSPAELQSGMLVLLKNCRRCGNDHELFLLNPKPDLHCPFPGDCAIWSVIGGHDPPCWVHYSIQEQRLFRVLDGGVTGEILTKVKVGQDV